MLPENVPADNVCKSMLPIWLRTASASLSAGTDTDGGACWVLCTAWVLGTDPGGGACLGAVANV